MEWVETTAKTIEAAREAALDQLGVAADEAEFETIEEPRPGLFGRVRGEARLRARVRPAQVRPKQERRRKGRGAAAKDSPATGDAEADNAPDTVASNDDQSSSTEPRTKESSKESTKGSNSKEQSPKRRASSTSTKSQEQKMSNDRPETTVTPEEVGAAAVAFMDGLTEAFGAEGTTSLEIDGTELHVSVSGTELGLLVGPGGRTLNAIQDLARVAAQRRLGDHETRLRIDVAGYRERREAALSSFARDVAEQVRTTGTARSLEPMNSADRKVVHDVLNDEPGVSSRSVGEDPERRIIVDPTDDVADAGVDPVDDADETSTDDE
jgi:spoIIIJ-associated protein